jgi:hypothetical protein
MTNSGRWYTWRGEAFASVTTILGTIAKPALVQWAAKLTAREAVDNLERLTDLAALDPDIAVGWLAKAPERAKTKSATTGSLVHLAAELLAGGKPAQVTPETEPLIRHLRRFLDDVRPQFLHQEVAVYSRAHGYAGTADAFAVIDGEPVIVDFKTSRGVYAEYSLQLAAYANAEFIGMPDGTEAPVPYVNRAFVVHLTPDGWRLVPVDTGPETFNAFLGALAIFRWQMQQRGGQNDA